MQKESLWEQYVKGEERTIKKLNGDIRTDVLIIGGGIAGILCAYRLKKAGVSCVVVEQENLLEGVTGNTTAKITAQHGLIYHKLKQTYGTETAGQYYEINQMAVKEYWKLAEQIPCDMEKKTACIYSTANKRKLEKEAYLYETLRIPYVWQESAPLPMQICGALGMKEQAQFNPAKLLLSLAAELDIYENTRVLDIEEGMAFTECGTIQAEQIVLATHFPMINIPGGYFVKLYQRKSYVLAVKDGPQIDGMYIDEKKDGFSFRNYKEYLLLGGGGHKTGTGSGGYEILEELVLKSYSDKKIAFAWSAQDCMSLDGIPYIGHHSKKRSHIFIATGFNKWGMTGAMSASIVLEQMLTRGKSDFEKLFSPQRSMIHPQLLINLGSALGNILRPGRRCTHMGCALRWNPQERTWDCPCHGSKFSENGSVLENPAKKRLKK